MLLASAITYRILADRADGSVLECFTWRKSPEAGIERAKRDGEAISPDDPDLNWAIKQFKITDDNLHTEPKKETA